MKTDQDNFVLVTWNFNIPLSYLVIIYCCVICIHTLLDHLTTQNSLEDFYTSISLSSSVEIYQSRCNVNDKEHIMVCMTVKFMYFILITIFC